ncbi:ANTAR domain-containing protein [Streptomyces sp. NPDC001046]|uniref:ANTAR domain-containing protein n=1 Tax=Streptomyces sp. NPDC001046 TaxID=3364543 RepID=UPI0036A66A1D
MTTSRARRPRPDAGAQDLVARLELEIAQLRQAVSSHATVDQAIGVLISAARIEPRVGFKVLRAVSQRTNIKVAAVAEAVIAWALGEDLPRQVAGELDRAVQQYAPAGHRLKRPC